MNNFRHTIEDAQKLALSKNGKCLSVEYKNNVDKLKWECSAGHTWESSFASMCKNWCRACTHNKKRNKLEDIRRKALENGLECLTEEYKNTQQKLHWKCKEKNHFFEKPYVNMYKVWRCPQCQYWTLEDAQNKANEKGGICLSDTYEKSNKLMSWRCQKGHEWKANFARILNGQWCRMCAAEKQRLGIEFAKSLARKRGGECLSNDYEKISNRLRWKCEFGHEWEATLSKVKNANRWCHYCKLGKNQRQLFNIIKSMFIGYTVKYNVRNISWLINAKTKMFMELDIVVYDKNDNIILAIEYDGRQHYESVEHLGGEKNHEEIKIRDRIKQELLNENKDKYFCFVRFSYREKLNEIYIFNKLNTVPGFKEKVLEMLDEEVIMKFKDQTGEAKVYYNIDDEPETVKHSEVTE